MLLLFTSEQAPLFVCFGNVTIHSFLFWKCVALIGIRFGKTVSLFARTLTFLNIQSVNATLHFEHSIFFGTLQTFNFIRAFAIFIRTFAFFSFGVLRILGKYSVPLQLPEHSSLGYCVVSYTQIYKENDFVAGLPPLMSAHYLCKSNPFCFFWYFINNLEAHTMPIRFFTFLF